MKEQPASLMLNANVLVLKFTKLVLVEEFSYVHRTKHALEIPHKNLQSSPSSPHRKKSTVQYFALL